MSFDPALLGLADGAARIRGHLRQLPRSAHDVGLDAVPSSVAPLHRPHHRHGRKPRARDPAQRGRGFRLQDSHLPGGAAHRLPRPQAGAAGEMDRGAHRKPANRRPCSRAEGALRSRLQAGRSDHRAEGQDRRRRRCAVGAGRMGDEPGHDFLHPHRLQGSQLPRRAVPRGNQQVPVERLPRLRQGDRFLFDGPDHGRRRARDRNRSRRGTDAQLHPAARVSLSAGERGDSR
jgi:hypothetical protein